MFQMSTRKEERKGEKKERKTATNLLSSLSGKSQQLSGFYRPCPRTWCSCHFHCSLHLHTHGSIELYVFVIHSKRGKDSRLLKWALVFRLIRYTDNNFCKGCIFNALTGGLKGGAVCSSLRPRIMGGVECQLNGILIGTFHSLLCNTRYICFLLLRNLGRFEEQILEAVTTHTCGILKAFADCVGLGLLHS